MTPIGKTYAQIDADEAEYVKSANEADQPTRSCGCGSGRHFSS